MYAKQCSVKYGILFRRFRIRSAENHIGLAIARPIRFSAERTLMQIKSHILQNTVEQPINIKQNKMSYITRKTISMQIKNTKL